MFKKITSVMVITAMLLAVLSVGTLAVADTTAPYAETTGFSSSWVKDHYSVTITAKDDESGVAMFKVNGENVAPKGGTPQGGVIKTKGTPYYKLKKIGYSEGILTLALFIGNIKTGAGQFALKYDKSNWQPYNSSESALIKEGDSAKDFFEAYKTSNAAKFGVSSSTAKNDIEFVSVNQGATKKASGIDITNGVAFVTWYTQGQIDALSTEKPILLMRFKEKDVDAVSGIGASTFTEPLISELDSPVMPYPSVLQENVSGVLENRATSLSSLDSVVEIDGTYYGVEVVGQVFKFSGSTEKAVNGKFAVEITDKAGNNYSKDFATMVDTTAPILTISNQPTQKCESFTATLTYSDQESGIDKITVDGAEITGTTFEITKNKTYVFKATDKVGNEKVVEYVVTAIKKGDINGDGKVDILDATLILMHEAKLSVITDEKALGQADVNNDGKVNYVDAMLILQYDAGLIKDL